MHNIGDVKTSREIWGGCNRHKFIWCSCKNCGKERWVLLVKGVPASKCCNACAVRKPRTGQLIQCGNCGKQIYVRPSSVRKKNYCSRECADKGNIKGKPLYCEVCGEEYYRPPSQIRWRGSSYCSNKCKGRAITLFKSGENNPNWKGGISTESHRLRASKKWKVWREVVFTRDDWTCQECGIRSMKGTKVKLHPHHVKSFAHYPKLRFEVSNGITLCEICHKELHRENKNRPS